MMKKEGEKRERELEGAIKDVWDFHGTIHLRIVSPLQYFLRQLFNLKLKKIATMRKLYENFQIFHFQKRIVSTETIRRNTVNPYIALTKELGGWGEKSGNISWHSVLFMLTKNR